jgi:hypothetical protein
MEQYFACYPSPSQPERGILQGIELTGTDLEKLKIMFTIYYFILIMQMWKV